MPRAAAARPTEAASGLGPILGDANIRNKAPFVGNPDLEGAAAPAPTSTTRSASSS